jgi:hypothetical protein
VISSPWHLLREPPAIAARAALGTDHPLAHALELQTVFVRDVLAVVGVALALAAATVIGFVSWPALVIALVVAGALVAAGLFARAAVRSRALDVIAEGRERVPVPAVARERERLLDARHRRMLAGSLARLRSAAERPAPWAPRSTVPAYPGTLRAVGPELAELEALLAQPLGTARGVALVKRLLVDGVSPLHGGDAQRLREELRRITLLLAA